MLSKFFGGLLALLVAAGFVSVLAANVQLATELNTVRADLVEAKEAASFWSHDYHHIIARDGWQAATFDAGRHWYYVTTNVRLGRPTPREREMIVVGEVRDTAGLAVIADLSQRNGWTRKPTGELPK